MSDNKTLTFSNTDRPYGQARTVKDLNERGIGSEELIFGPERLARQGILFTEYDQVWHW